MKSKKIFVSIVAALSTVTCMASLSTSGAMNTKRHYVNVTKDTSFTDRGNNCTNCCTYKTKLKTSCYYQATLTMDSTGVTSYGKHITNPSIVIYAQKTSGAWVEVAHGKGYISANLKVTKNVLPEKIYKTISYENNSGYLISELNFY